MSDRLRIGFIPLCDASALLVAVDKGFAAAEGLEIELVREVSWSNMRDKLNIGHFDAAHLIAPVAIASSLGLGHIKVPIIAPFALGVNGNAITRLTRAARGSARGGRGRHPRSDGVGAGPRARGRGAQGRPRGAAHLRHDLPILDAQLSPALLDGGGRRRSGRGRAAGGAAAALHGGEPAEPAGGRVLRRRAVEFGRGRSRHRSHPAFQFGDPCARHRKISWPAPALGRREPRHRAAAHPRASARGGFRRAGRQPRRGRGSARCAAPHRGRGGGDPPHARRPAEGFAGRRLPLRRALSPDRPRGRRAPGSGAGGLALRPDGALGTGAAVARVAGRRQGGVPARPLRCRAGRTFCDRSSGRRDRRVCRTKVRS